jgi:hypothetical protein
MEFLVTIHFDLLFFNLNFVFGIHFSFFNALWILIIFILFNQTLMVCKVGCQNLDFLKAQVLIVKLKNYYNRNFIIVSCLELNLSLGNFVKIISKFILELSNISY